MASAPAEESLPPSRVVRWMALGAVIVACVGLYFRWGMDVPPVGSVPASDAPPPADAPPPPPPPATR